MLPTTMKENLVISRAPVTLSIVAVVAALDLDPIKLLLRDRPPHWTVMQCEVVEKWYRRFLSLAVLYPDESLEPITKELDEFWHQHILCTEKYVEDCNRVFGHYLHHAPTPPGDSATGGIPTGSPTREKLESFGESVDELVQPFHSSRRGLAGLIRD